MRRRRVDRRVGLQYLAGKCDGFILGWKSTAPGFVLYGDKRFSYMPDEQFVGFNRLVPDVSKVPADAWRKLEKKIRRCIDPNDTAPRLRNN